MAELIDRGPDGPLRNLYVHVPYCTDRCTYCAFATVSDRPTEHGALVDALLAELQRAPEATWSTVYLGGGTPGLLSPAHLGRLLDGIREHGVDADAELTLESNPAEVDDEHLRAWNDLGITRLSVGIQTFTDDALRNLGRHHDGRRARQALDALASQWSGTWSADLLVGWRGQDGSRLAQDLDQLVAFRPPHISVYALTVEPGAALHQAAQKGFKVSTSSLFSDLFDSSGAEALKAAGYERYEVSNFARPHHRSRHNQAYWANASYLGLGPGASSSLHPMRWANIRDPAGYMAAVQGSRTARQLTERVSPLHRLMESLGVGLRTADGVAISALDARFSPAWRERVRPAAHPLVEAGFLAWTDTALTVPAPHLARTDRIVSELVMQLDAGTSPEQDGPLDQEPPS